ncbi:WxL domain-containing protein [Companilactobacillus baiquanensis]|uniref:WxL domain-containing protein n=1 Tax=Companilactobacillus baiquanensis TaxID=2486005 RepID=A0ABW1UYK8_9LACO|nr:WxL domain-containing protein [Companilactobacillus baiquanensis]
MNDKDNPGLAIAYDDGTGTQANMKTATAESDANVKIISGILTLDKVPDFGFGTAAAGSTVDLQDNSSVIDNDGNQSGILQVTDSRANGTTAGSTAGFDVTAQLGAFTDGTKNADGTDKAVEGAFTLALQPVQLTTSTNSKDVIQGQKSLAASMTSGGTGSASDTAPVLNLAKDSYSNGAIIAQFAAQTGSPNADAQLTVPGEAANATNASVKSVHSIITWTLTPKAMDKTAASGE